MRIGISEPYISIAETEYAVRVLRSGQISQGKEVEKFEKELASYLKVKEAVGVIKSANTTALAKIVAEQGLPVWHMPDLSRFPPADKPPAGRVHRPFP